LNDLFQPSSLLSYCIQLLYQFFSFRFQTRNFIFAQSFPSSRLLRRRRVESDTSSKYPMAGEAFVLVFLFCHRYETMSKDGSLSYHQGRFGRGGLHGGELAVQFARSVVVAGVVLMQCMMLVMLVVVVIASGGAVLDVAVVFESGSHWRKWRDDRLGSEPSRAVQVVAHGLTNLTQGMAKGWPTATIKIIQFPAILT
jgi:hypothetical protein